MNHGMKCLVLALVMDLAWGRIMYYLSRAVVGTIPFLFSCSVCIFYQVLYLPLLLFLWFSHGADLFERIFTEITILGVYDYSILSWQTFSRVFTIIGIQQNLCINLKQVSTAAKPEY